VESVVAVSPAALQRAGPAGAGAGVEGAVVADSEVPGPAAAAAAAAGWLSELLGEAAGVLDVWDCGVLALQPARRSAAAAAAVVNTSLLLIR
jgi:hypothetical protein